MWSIKVHRGHLTRCSTLQINRLMHAAAASTDTNSPEVVELLQKPSFNFKRISEHADAMHRNAQNRNVKTADAYSVKTLYRDQCSLIGRVNEYRQRRNELNGQLKGLTKLKGDDVVAKRSALVQESQALKSTLTISESELSDITKQLYDAAGNIPNETHPNSPIGAEENARIVAMRNDKPHFAFTPKDHVELGKYLDLFDFEAASAVSGHSFYYLKNAAARLELALIQYAVDFVSDRGFTVVTTPDVVKTGLVEACGFKPRDVEATQTYCLEKPYEHLALSGTAEIPLAGLFMGKTFKASQLPIKVVAFGRAFRAEAGAYGAANKGLYRVHQFSKVEMFVVSESEGSATVGDGETQSELATKCTESDELLEEIRTIQDEFLQSLGLHFRVLDMPTEELGAAAYRKYDMEAYMPGRALSSDVVDGLAFGEVTSASNCTDFQARRLNIKYKTHDSSPSLFAHTLNGTACAVPRVIIALLETHQNEDGTVNVPEALHSYMRGKVIRPPERVF
ncbi:seryl-tRNA synthetase, variant [Sphaeroforma arctica JP610]|uniref:serine--tRNA ligase n=1 Tax=Sphaeroforma arctica JP610 TaxID=667725 RepID=A0A0L0GE69_9EUKA|nr:seryl-tRNA synthetase, variant [Sphaeroforma arctica JP610]KNC87189.1 seryl-tRNA synthetase, variant [Sphaeroforma arctica JP610]|eukprot:XP_014161092.1 seryl-tRNA synthetase, variant [Sphaeroforma arctica JP610]